MITIRKLSDSDRDTLAFFLEKLSSSTRKFWHHYKSVDEVYAEKSYKLVVLSEEEIIGLASLIPHENYPDTPALSIIIADNWQNKGIGRKLMNALEDWALELGFRNIFLTTYKNNKKAETLYRSLGYKILATITKNKRKVFTMKKDLEGLKRKVN